jgi:hypothetical protein
MDEGINKPDELGATVPAVIPSSKTYNGKQLLTFTNTDDFNAVWIRVKEYRKANKIRTMGDAVLDLVKKALL